MSLKVNWYFPSFFVPPRATLSHRPTIFGCLSPIPSPINGHQDMDATAHTAPAPPPSEPAVVPARPRLLVVDDDEMNRDVLTQRLTAQNFDVASAANGHEGLERLRKETFDLVLLDMVMPVMEGYEVLQAMKADERLMHVPVIMISALDELDSVARCIEIGADDYLPKPFKPVLLQARIRSCLEKKQLRDQERSTFAALVESQKHLATELSEAAAYVRSLLPEPMEGLVTTDWRFITSTSLGGDSFGYYWLDDDHLAMYLLDVCGHGVGAALLSISAMNVLRSQALPSTDFKNPGAVLEGLNEAFQMEKQGNMYFTIWYGVFNKAKRKITYARGGHPPAILLTGDTRDTALAQELKSPGMVIGSMPGLPYRTATADLGAFAQMYLFSDGVYELSKPDGTMWDFDEFVKCLINPPANGESELDAILKTAQTVQGGTAFEDDFSMVKFNF